MSAAKDGGLTLLAIDDDSAILGLVTATLQPLGLQVVTAANAAQGMEYIRRYRPRLVLLDLVLPDKSGLELLEEIVKFDPGAQVIMMTAHYSTESAVEAILKGACDYLTKPLPLEKLRERIRKLVQEAELRNRSLQLECELLEAYQFEGMVGRSPLMLEVFGHIQRFARHFRTVLVTGPTGSGKELVARALHQQSPVASGPFVVVNCSAIVETLAESELFGHVKGAFTGATQDKVGLVEAAHGGTLFLDEIGELHSTTQAKILRVLQNLELQRVGSIALRKVDVRMIAATNRDLRRMAHQKHFRDDLYYRLSMLEIRLPALADRKEDLPLLQRHFLDQFARQYQKPIGGITRRAQALLARYPWPGNVRELESVIGRACMITESDFIDVQDLPEYLRNPGSQKILQADELLSLDELQCRHIQRVLHRVNGNKRQAAEILGISPTTLYRLLSRIQEESETLG